jgi:hypothetical protein
MLFESNFFSKLNNKKQKIEKKTEEVALPGPAQSRRYIGGALLH